MGNLAHLKVQVEFTGDLGPPWTVNSYGVDWKFVPFEGPFRGSLGRVHDGKREVPWNPPITMTELATRPDHIPAPHVRHAAAKAPNAKVPEKFVGGAV